MSADFYEEYVRRKKKESDSFLKGMVTGAFVVLLCILTTLAILIKMDFISFGGSYGEDLASKLNIKLS
ncbi:MAG: hypothetical protein ACI4EV_00885, partial [Lachnospiraceae bacterium]